MMSYPPRPRVPSYMYSQQYSGFEVPRQAIPANLPRNAVKDPGYNTSANDPYSQQCRVFVGNLNTAVASREKILQTYSVYGYILGLTVFKGYAFVQYGSVEEALSAVAGTNKTMFSGQTLDVKLVSESKNQARAPAQKHKQQVFSSGGTQAKKPKTESQTASRQLLSVPVVNNKECKPNTEVKKPKVIQDDSKPDELTAYEFQDTLICGNCRSVYNNWVDFRDHRKNPCSLTVSSATNKPAEEPEVILCFVCKESFQHSWHLLTHLSALHHLHVYMQDKEEKVGNLEDIERELKKET